MMSNIKIGKNAIENLTIGMYNDSKIIYREYIQNAADSIDLACKDGIYEKDEKPQIEIELDNKERIIRIKDNAYGVKVSEIDKKLANVADSDKERGVNKGFRGIGRLGGLAYCETLKFITTYPSEDVETTMTWDANELIRLINDPTIKDSAVEVLDKVISYSKNPCASEAHYFIVELEHIRDENSELLDIGEVKKYLSANVPVDYNNKFYLKSDIKKFISTNQLNLSEYRVFIDGEDIFKAYNHVLYEKSGETLKPYDKIESLEFKEFRNKQNELLAWIWFGVCDFNKQIPPCNDMRGIRVRKDNIQIGDHYTLIKFFKDQRGNYYFIGELHAVHSDLVPNARRDYFIENNTRLELENEIKEYFKILQNLYYAANKAKSACNKEIKLADVKAEYVEKEKTGFICNDEKETLESKIANAKKDSEKSQREFNRLKEKSKSNPLFSKVISSIEEKHKKNLSPKSPEDTTIEKKEKSSSNSPSISPRDNSPSNTSPKSTPSNSSHSSVSPSNIPRKTPLLTDNLIHLNENERKLIGNVYKVIQSVLPPAQSSNLIKKIQDELNKNES